MSQRPGYLHDYLVASFIGLAFGMLIGSGAADVAAQGAWGTYIAILFVAGIFGMIPAGLVVGYINFRFHEMGENKPMAGLSATVFAAVVYTVIGLILTIELTIINTANAANNFMGWILAVVFAFIFLPIGGYLSGIFEDRSFAMPSFFNIAKIQRVPPPPPPADARNCPTCGQTLRFVEQYNRWYCDNEKKYI